jgi:hypothetical protein
MKRAYLLLGVLSLIIAWRVVSVPKESSPVTLEETKAPTDPFLALDNATAENPTELPKESTEKKFKVLLNETLLALPTEASTKAKQVDPHHGDPGIGDASQPLGKIVREMRSHPELIPEGLVFYRSCALKKSVIPAIRALCLRNLFDWNEKSPNKIELSWDDYPSQIQFIAKQLPVTK